MAKKNTDASSSTTPAAGNTTRRRSTARRAVPTEAAASPIDLASVAAIEPLEAAADRDTRANHIDEMPTYEQIAEAAYLRYVSRGGDHGRDFDDWIEAERALTLRRSR